MPCLPPSDYNLNIIPAGVKGETDASKQQRVRQSGDNLPGRLSTTASLPGKTDGEHACYLTTLSVIRTLYHLFGEMWCCLVVTTWILSLRCIVTLRHEFRHSAVLSHYDMNSVTPLYCHITTWILSLLCIVTLQHEFFHSAVLSHYDMNSVTPLYCHFTTWSWHCDLLSHNDMNSVTPLYCRITSWILSLRCIVTLRHEVGTPLYCHITTSILSLSCIITLQHDFCHSAVLSHNDMNSVTPLYCHLTTWILSHRCIVT